MNLTAHQEEKLRRGLGVIVNEAPPGKDFEKLTTLTVVPVARRPRGVWVAAAALVGVLGLFSPLLLMSEPEPLVGPPNEPIAPVATAPEDPVVDDAAADEPLVDERFPVVVEVVETGDLIALQRRHAFRSTDGGESWTEILGHGGVDLIDVMPDGTLIAIRNGTEHEFGVFGPNTWVREPGYVHRYDQLTAEWERTELPRPAFPVDDPVPAPMDGSTGCGLAGIHWTWDALSIAIGKQIVIAGEQRIVEENICDESFQFFWVSDDGGHTWAIIQETGIPGYIVSLTWFDGRYVATGTDSKWYSGAPERSLQVWTSSDLTVWDEAHLDLSVLPDNALPSTYPDNEVSWGLGNTATTMTGDILQIQVSIWLVQPGPPAEISSLDELNEWAVANGREHPITQELVDLLGIDFPPDDDELRMLHGYFLATERGGRLILETADGLTWTTSYGD
jgi:hypothetical protein